VSRSLYKVYSRYQRSEVASQVEKLFNRKMNSIWVKDKKRIKGGIDVNGVNCFRRSQLSLTISQNEYLKVENLQANTIPL
jgi:hypothetical protein